jgi:predicted AlkP superfamily phosphohydrolase/phosphomutase/Flp pilus assembly protein TadD
MPKDSRMAVSLPRRLGVLLGCAVLAATALLPACTGQRARPRVLVLGLDGLDPATIDLLAGEGKLPNFSRLKKEGAGGTLLAREPLLSPILWTTMATGRGAETHGIGHFVAQDAGTGQDIPVTSGLRRVKALWNMASDAGLRVAVVGWWATWPAEAVNGVIVSDHACYHFLFEEGFEPPRESVGNIHPRERDAELTALLRRPQSVGADELARFADVDAVELARDFDFADELSHFRWALATAESYRSVARELWSTDDPQLLMAYFELPDTTSHLFGHLFRAEGLSGELAQQQRRFGHAVEEVYVLADEILGDFLEWADEETTLVVMSDHGFELGRLHEDPSKTRDLRRVSEHFHRASGYLGLHGRGVKVGSAVEGATQLDIAPTILQLLGLPVARDLEGRVLSEALSSQIAAPESIETWEDGDSGKDLATAGSDVDPLIMEKLRALGYVGAVSGASDRNLAAIQFRAGDHETAERRYAELLEERPGDAALHASRAGALGALGRDAEALEELKEARRLDPLLPEIHHNLAVLLENQGKKEEAVESFRRARRDVPTYRPSREALLRLTGRAAVLPVLNEARRTAVALAQEASEAARRGDYPAASALLDEAEAQAPGLALLHQYRSNVAYLQGDVVAARAALERALELEPDNELFRKNLGSLPSPSSP